MAPRVSIVLPTYNQAALLPEALEGINAQTFKDFELIIVNDGSSDSTSQVLHEYRKKMSFILIEQENRKLPRALNAGFAVAKGNLLTWTSSDNVMLPDMLAELVDALDLHPEVGLVYADWIFIDEQGNRLGGFQTLDYDRHLLLRQNYIHCCFLYRRACMERIGTYDPEYIYSEDWEYWIRMSRLFRMKRVPKPLYLYRVHAKTMTAELLDGTAQQNIGHSEFDARIKSAAPADWYISKLKWWFLVHMSRRNPRSEWLRYVTNS